MPSKIRQKIIESAVGCFAESGYCGTSTKAIAQAANVTEGSLFRLFDSKEKLFDEALALVRDRSLPQKDFDRLLNSGSIAEGMQRAFGALSGALTRDTVRLLRFAVLERNETVREVLNPGYDARVRSVSKRIRAGIKSREVRKDIDPAAAATVIYFSVRNLPFDSYIGGRTKKQTAVLVEKSVNFFLHGLLR
jgi:AcrR family transcriptional regulator